MTKTTETRAEPNLDAFAGWWRSLTQDQRDEMWPHFEWVKRGFLASQTGFQWKALQEIAQLPLGDHRQKRIAEAALKGKL